MTENILNEIIESENPIISSIKDEYDSRNITASELELVTGDVPESFDFSEKLKKMQDQTTWSFYPYVSCGPTSQSMALDVAEIDALFV